MVKFIMGSFEANILSEDMMKMHLEPNGSVSKTKNKTSHIFKRMKLSNLNGADLFQVKEDNCNIIVN